MLESLFDKTIKEEEFDKFNVHLFYYELPDISSKRVIYERDDAKCSYSNSQDITVGRFYKQVSLLIKHTNNDEPKP